MRLSVTSKKSDTCGTSSSLVPDQSSRSLQSLVSFQLESHGLSPLSLRSIALRPSSLERQPLLDTNFRVLNNRIGNTTRAMFGDQ